MSRIGVQEVAILHNPYPTIQETDLQKEIFPLLSTNVLSWEVKRDGIACGLFACDLWNEFVPDNKKVATSTPSSGSYLDPEVFACTVQRPPPSHPNQINWSYLQHNHNHDIIIIGCQSSSIPSYLLSDLWLSIWVIDAAMRAHLVR